MRKSRALTFARLQDRDRQLLTVVQTLQAQKTRQTSRRAVDHHRTGRGDEPGEPVDPVQSALWGLRDATVIAEQPALRCRLVDSDGFDDAVPVGRLIAHRARPRRDRNSLRHKESTWCSRLLPWARSGHLPVPRATDYILDVTERGAIDNLHLVETKCRRRARARCRSGWRPQA